MIRASDAAIEKEFGNAAAWQESLVIGGAEEEVPGPGAAYFTLTPCSSMASKATKRRKKEKKKNTY